MIENIKLSLPATVSIFQWNKEGALRKASWNMSSSRKTYLLMFNESFRLAMGIIPKPIVWKIKRIAR